MLYARRCKGNIFYITNTTDLPTLLLGGRFDHLALQLKPADWSDYLAIFCFCFFVIAQNTPEADCSRYFMGVLVGSPSLRLTESEKRSIFRIHLEHGLKDMRLDEEDKVRNPPPLP